MITKENLPTTAQFSEADATFVPKIKALLTQYRLGADITYVQKDHKYRFVVRGRNNTVDKFLAAVDRAEKLHTHPSKLHDKEATNEN